VTTKKSELEEKWGEGRREEEAGEPLEWRRCCVDKDTQAKFSSNDSVH
jgi:hypothetical protein